MEQMQYVCPKCGNTQYESDQFQATGGNFAKIFDVQNKKFITVSCTGERQMMAGTCWIFWWAAETPAVCMQKPPVHCTGGFCI